MKITDRVEITQATIDEFLNKSFEWKTRDCAALTHNHLKRAGVVTPFEESDNYTTAIGAVRAMKKCGFDSLEAVMDANLESIPPAFAMVGDILALPAEEKEDGSGTWHPLSVHCGEGRALAFVVLNGATKCVWGDASLAVMAWRLP